MLVDSGDIAVAVAVGLFVVALVVANGVASRRVWNDALSERAQKIAQLAVIWLVPGTFLVVRFLLAPDRPSGSSDPTVSTPWGADDSLDATENASGGDHGGGT